MRGCALLALLATSCLDVVEHGNPVTLSINMLDCDGTTRAAGATELTITARSADAVVLSRAFKLDALPRTIALPEGTDFTLRLEANDSTGKLVASGSSTHFAVPATTPIPVELFPANRFSKHCKTLATARAHHSATLLADGSVLIIGGEGSTGALSSMELVTANEVRSLGHLAIRSMTGVIHLPRAHHAAVRTSTGQVVVSGGETSSVALSTTLVVDPASDFGIGAVGPGTSPALPRSRHAAFEVNGGVFFIGGHSAESAQAIDRYDLETHRVAAFSSLPQARLEAAVGRLGATAIIAGGVEGAFTSDRIDLVTLDASQVVAPLTLLSPRRSARAVTIGQRVLIVGGFDENGRPMGNTEWLDVAARTVTAGPMVSPRGELCAVALPLGRVLLVGGASVPEVLHADGTIELAAFEGSNRVGQACVATENGSVLISGGTALDDLWLYTPGN